MSRKKGRRTKQTKHDSKHEDEHEDNEDEEEEEKSTHHEKHHENKHKSVKLSSKKRKTHKPSQDNFNIWFWVSMGLVVCLILLFTYTSPFMGDKDLLKENQDFVSEIDELISTTDNAELKSALNELKTSALNVEKKLLELKEEMQAPQGNEDTSESSQEDLGSETPGTGTASDSVTMEFYVMSQCPYGTQVVDEIAPAKKKLGDVLDLQIEFIFYPRAQYAGQESTFCVEDFCGMHGVPEVKGNFVQLCAIEHEPDKYLDMLLCMNKNANAIPNNWEQCAKDNNLNVEKIRECYEGEEALKLAEETQSKADARQARGSPTIFLNDKPYSGGRTEMDFMRAICNEFEERPEACAQIPEPVKVDLIVLNDERCSSCDDTQIIMVSQQLFPGVKVQKVDVSSEEGKELVEKYGIELVPAYIFGENVVETQTWKAQPQIQAAFQKKGTEYKLMDSQTGADHYIDDEKRQQALEIPMKTLGITEDSKPQLDFFVMSFCPYGIQAEDGIIPAYELLKNDANFVPHFVIYGQGTGCIEDVDGSKYCSLHGRPELDEDIRQMCIYELEETDKFFTYIKLIAADYNNGQTSDKNIESKWKDYANQAGIDVAKIEECFNDEDKVLEMLRKEVEKNQILKVSGSPTVFVNGQAYSGGRSPEDFKSAICDAFEERPSACEGVLSSQGTQAAGSC